MNSKAIVHLFIYDKIFNSEYYNYNIIRKPLLFCKWKYRKIIQIGYS